jgi:hypothetical protein
MALKHKIIIGILLLVAVVAATAAMTYRVTSPDTSNLSCVAGQDEICPSAQWVKVSDELNQMVSKANEMSRSLNSAVPGGFHYDQATGKFEKNAPTPTNQAAQPSTPQPTPATPPKK